MNEANDYYFLQNCWWGISANGQQPIVANQRESVVAFCSKKVIT
jgi:hypothetical protein